MHSVESRRPVSRTSRAPVMYWDMARKQPLALLPPPPPPPLSGHTGEGERQLSVIQKKTEFDLIASEHFLSHVSFPGPIIIAEGVWL